MIFPDKEWTRADPKDLGFDANALAEVDKLMKTGGSNGMLLSDGRAVAQWTYAGPLDRRFEVQSVTKSFTAMVLALAMDDKLIPSLDMRVKDVYPGFEAGPYTEAITFRHLATMTSGIKATLYSTDFPQDTPPGKQMTYHNDHPQRLAQALTWLYGRPMYDVLKERILDPIGAKAVWPECRAPWSPIETGDKGKVPVAAGFAFFEINAPDLARVGHLFMNKGRWKGRQLLSAKSVAETWKESGFRDAAHLLIVDHEYGLYWWRLLPGIWYMWGKGNQFCLVWPERGVVFTKINGCTPEPEGTHMRHIFPLIYRAATGRELAAPAK